MRIIAVDDEILALKNLEIIINESGFECSAHYDTSPIRASEWLNENTVDIALLDINMKQMNGIVLAKIIKEKYPECAIIFITGYSKYAVEAFSMKASGYLIKPYDKDDLIRELDYAKSGLLSLKKEDKKTRIFVECFGNFEAFGDNTPIAFRYSKTKELFAYLIDKKGSSASSGELISALWEDKEVTISVKAQLRNLVSDLSHTLKKYGEDDIIKKANRCISIDTSRIQCDYYCFLNNEIWAVNKYKGEYMKQYSWAEMTIANLEIK